MVKARRMLQQEDLRKGFTLLQMILTLIIVAIIGIGGFHLNQHSVDLQAKMVVAQVLEYYELIQKEAVLNQQQCLIQFRADRISFGELGCEPQTFILPEGVVISHGKNLYMLKSGSLSQLETISIETPRKLLQIRFQMGSGQYVYEEF